MSISPGVRAGVNLAKFGGDDADVFSGGGQLGQNVDLEEGRRTGYAVGGFLLVDLAGPLAIQPELMYIQKGYTADFSVTALGQTISGSSTVELSYLEVPVLAKFQIPMAGPFSPTIFAGPTVAYNLSAEQVTEAGGQSDSEDISDSLSGTEVGAQFGVGADFGLGAGTLSIDARYGYGLSSLPDSGDASVKNRGIMLTAGLTF